MHGSLVRLGLILFAPVLFSGCTDETVALQSTVFDNCAALALSDVSDGENYRINRLQRAIIADPENIPALEKLAWAYVDKSRVGFDPGYSTLASYTAKCMLQKQADSVAAQLVLGHVALVQHKFSDAERIARSLVATRGLWTDFGLLGDALSDQGNLDEAVAAYEQMMAQRPGPQAYSRAAHVRWLTGDTEGAIEMMIDAVQSTSPRAKEASAWARVQLADYMFAAGHADAAAELLNLVLREFPDYSPALSKQGQLMLAKNDFTAALELIQQAVAANPSPLHYWQLVEVLGQIDDQPQRARAQLQLQRIGRIEDPRSYALYLLTTDQDYSLALSLAKQEIKKRKDVFTLDALAWAYFKNGDAASAWPVAQQSVSEGTEHARLFLHAGSIARHLGYEDEAHQWLQKASQFQHMLMPSERQTLADQLAYL